MSPRRIGRRLAADRTAAVTVEFALLFPVVAYLFVVAFELGLWHLREMTLRHATASVMREVRVNTGRPPDYEEMKAAICARSLFRGGCEESLRIEMRGLPLARWRDIADRAACVDRREPVEPLTTFRPGAGNELMVLRVCRLFEPIVPGGALGRRLAENTGGEYGVRVVTAFVAEPIS